MKRSSIIRDVRLKFFKLFLILIVGFGIMSCEDDYLYTKEEPEWLGESIYDYLKSEKNYSTYLKLVEEVGYKEVLSKTGSKTIFVSNDEAFDRFFSNNSWGVSSYEQLTMGQKKIIMNFGMIDNAYLLSSLANYYYGGTLVEGTAFRRVTANSFYDSIKHSPGTNLPDTKYWSRFKDKGIRYISDDSYSYQFFNSLLYFLERPLKNADISNEDFKIITGKERQDGDAHIYNIPVIERDIICKNGYVHILEDVLIPPPNMADYLLQDNSTTIFSSLLERFSAPYYLQDYDTEYKLINPSFSDSLFFKIYFSPTRTLYPDGTIIPSDLRLLYMPGLNSFDQALQADMATMLVPTDDVMTSYLENGTGMILKERFGSWQGIPDHIVKKFLDRHMRTSFIESVPSRFGKMMDSNNDPVPITTADIESSVLASNGLIYKTKEVYPPNDYVSVYAPVLFGANTRIFDWVINKLDYTFYLNSMVSNYSFFVPTDEFFENYIDPFTYGDNKDINAALKFKYDDATSEVRAIIYSYDASTNSVGDSIGVIRSGIIGSANEYSNFVVNRLWDLLDNHLIVGDVENGSKYALTKGGTLVKTDGVGSSMKVQGGGDIARNNVVNVTDVYRQANGNTFFIDAPIQSSVKSVYSVLSKTPEFSVFYDLLSGFPSGNKLTFFVRTTNYYGVDYNIRFLNTFNYTIYVPTNEAVLKAITDGVISPWESSRDYPNAVGINDYLRKANDENENEDVKQAALKTANEEMEKLERFLRYHFQDNSLLISGEPISNKFYQSATIKRDDDPTLFGTYKNKYYKLEVSGDGDNINIHTESDSHVAVKKDKGLYNIITRDFIFNGDPVKYKEADGSGSGANLYNTSRITTSSTAVIHQIDNVLMYK